MKPISICKLTVHYKSNQQHISSQQFRGAFIDYIRTHFTKKQQEKLPMHFAFNKDENGKNLNRYSLMQYKTYKNKLEIVAIGKSKKIIKKWLKLIIKNNNFTINGKHVTLNNCIKNTQYWYPQLLNKPQAYKISLWKPYGTKDNKEDETLFYGKIIGNIKRLLADNNIDFKEKFEFNIVEYQRKKMTKGYKISWITYDLVFTTNLNLPQHIGLGREVSLGSGKISKLRIM